MKMLGHGGCVVVLLFSTALLIASANESQHCPSRGVTFPGPDHTSYYDCERGGGAPVFKRCLTEHVYWELTGECHPVTKPESELHVKSEIGARPKKKKQHAPISGKKSVADAKKREGSGTPPAEKVNDKEVKDDGYMTAPVMGRVVYLGDLYDAKTNQIYVGESLWSAVTLNSSKVTSFIPSSKTEFANANTLQDKIGKLDISAELEVGLMSGAITVKGSGGYLRDSVDTSDVISATMSYKATTHSESIPKNVMGSLDFNNMCSIGATHVVTTVTYGMDATFVFNKKLKKGDVREEIKGSLKIAIKKIPKFEIEGEASISINGTEKKEYSDLDVKIHGDFLLDRQPNSYADTVDIYQKLPTYLGAGPEYIHAAKISMRLSPVSDYCSGTAVKMQKMTAEMVHKISNVMTEIDETTIQVKTMMQSGPAMRYEEVNKVFSTFYKGIKVYKKTTQKTLQSLLPKIRIGDETAIRGLLTVMEEHIASKYSKGNSVGFLGHRKREIQMLQHIIDETYEDRDPDKVKKIKVVDETKGTMVTNILSKSKVIAVTYYVLPDPCITQKYLDGTHESTDDDNAWFNNEEVIAKLGGISDKLKKFATVVANEDVAFLVSLEPSKSDSKGNKIYKQVYAQWGREGSSTDFNIPPAPVLALEAFTQDSITISGKNFETFDLKVTYSEVYEEDVLDEDDDVEDDVNPDEPLTEALQKEKEERETRKKEKAVQKKKLEEEIRQKRKNTEKYADRTKVIKFKRGQNKFNKVIVALEPNAMYRFTAQYVTPVGLSPISKAVTRKTSASSAPSQLLAVSTTEQEINLVWGQPLYMPREMTVVASKITWHTGNGNTESKVLHDTTQTIETILKFTIPSLQPATTYTILVRATLRKVTQEGRSPPAYSDDAVLVIKTRPNPPATPRHALDEIQLTNPTKKQYNAVISWLKPADATGYTLKYFRLDSQGISPLLGTGGEIDIDNADVCKKDLPDLLSGGTYGVQIKMKTSAEEGGDSVYSPPSFFKVPLDVDNLGEEFSVEDIKEDIITNGNTAVVPKKIKEVNVDITKALGKLDTLRSKVDGSMTLNIAIIQQTQKKWQDGLDGAPGKYRSAVLTYTDGSDARRSLDATIETVSTQPMARLVNSINENKEANSAILKTFQKETEKQIAEAEDRVKLVPAWFAFGTGKSEHTVDKFDLEYSTCESKCSDVGRMMLKSSTYDTGRIDRRCYCDRALNTKYLGNTNSESNPSLYTYFVKYIMKNNPLY